jgi:hypothetical protein
MRLLFAVALSLVALAVGVVIGLSVSSGSPDVAGQAVTIAPTYSTPTPHVIPPFVIPPIPANPSTVVPTTTHKTRNHVEGHRPRPPKTHPCLDGCVHQLG